MPPVESKLDYTKARDIHSAGIVLLQMLLGHDVMERFNDPQSALHAGKTSVCAFRTQLNCRLAALSPFLSTKAAAMLSPAKRSGVSCQTLLLDLVSPPCPVPNNRTPTIPFAGPSMASLRLHCYAAHDVLVRTEDPNCQWVCCGVARDGLLPDAPAYRKAFE